ncbi:MAG: LapA family protein [Erythrobacter sp.]
MQIVRTIIWVVLAAFVVMFVLTNFGEPQRVKIWPSENPIGFDWPVGVIALVFWLVGVIPTWLYHRGVKWSLNRRIRSLEASIKSNALAHRPDPGTGSSAATESTPPPAPEAKPTDSLTPAPSSTESGSA